MKHVKFVVTTIEGFVEMHKDVCAELTEQEQRICAKTAINMVLAWNESMKKGVEYARNLTPIQKEGIRKFIEIAVRLRKSDSASTMRALANLGM